MCWAQWFLPFLPFLLRVLFPTDRVEHLPERRRENNFCRPRNKIILVNDLLGKIIDANALFDLPPMDEPRQQALFHDIELLRKGTNLFVHIVKALAKHIHGKLIMTMVFIEIE